MFQNTIKHKHYDIHNIDKLILLTLLMVLFSLGIFFGELFTDIDRISKMIGGISTAISVVIGLKIISSAIKKSKWLLSSSIAFIVIANVSYTIEVENVITYLFYNISTILTMILLYTNNNKIQKD